MIRLIVVCETRASSKTDYKYIKSVIDYYYKPRSYSIKPIYATSKPELIKQDKKIEKEINDYPGQAIVVLFADVDLDLCKTREESGIDLGTIRLENKL